MKLFIAIFIATLSIISHADPKAVHGMVVFGDQTTYISHLPMFHSPHDYQFVAEVQMNSAPRSYTMDYYQDAKDEGETLFTIVPMAFDLSKMISGEITMMIATLYAGHFEQGGKPLGPVEIKIKQQIISKKLVDLKGETQFKDYVVFGKEGEYFAVHEIQEQPSFDFIAKVDQPYTYLITRAGEKKFPIHDDQLPVTITDFKLLEIDPNHEAEHGSHGSDFDIPVPGQTIGIPGSFGRSAQTEVLEVIYQNTDELAH